jgi:MFS family permease
MADVVPSAPAHSPWAAPVLLLIVFVSLIGFGVVIPLLPFYGEIYDAEAWQVTLLFAVFAAGQFLGELTWGRLSDRIGRRPVILLTILASALGYVALAFAPNIWVAIVARGIGGVFAGNMSTIQGYIVDVTPREKLSGRLGLIGSAFGVGFVVGPALGGFLAHPEIGVAGFRPPLFVAAGLCVTASLGVLAFVRESRQTDRHAPRGPGPLVALREALADKVLQRLLGSTFISFMGFSSLWSVLGLWGQARFGWGPREIAGIMSITGLAAALSQGLLSAIVVRRVGEVNAICGGLIITSLFLAIQAFSPSTWFAAGLMTIAVVGHTLSQPATTSLISRAADADRQGSILGANAAASSLSRVCGPIIAGLLFSEVGPVAPFMFAAAAMLPAAWLASRGARLLILRGVP